MLLSKSKFRRERKITINIEKNGQWNSSLKSICLPFYNEAKVDLVLIQAFLLCYVNHVAVMLTGIFY